MQGTVSVFSRASARLGSHGVALLLCLIVVLGLGIRLVMVEEKSLWQDELYTLASANGNNVFEATIRPDDVEESGVSREQTIIEPSIPHRPSYYWRAIAEQQPWESFWDALSRNIQMPMYPMVMRLWASQIEASPLSFRYFSVLVGTLCIPVAFLLGQQLRDSRFGLLLAALVAVSGFQVTYSQTARVYALLTLLTLCSTWLLLRLLAQRGQVTGTWVGFGLVSVCGLYSHYLYVFILGFQATYALLRASALLGSDLKPFLQKLILTGLGIGVCYAPWLPMFQAQQAFQAEVGHGNLLGLWNPLSLIERLWNILSDLIAPKFLLAKILCTLLVGYGGYALWKRPEDRPILLLGGLWLLFIVGGMIGLDLLNQTHRILSKRYTMMASPALYLLLAGGLWALPRSILRPATGAVLALLTWNAWEVVTGPKFIAKENYRAAAHWILEEAQPGRDLVLVNHAGVHLAGMAFYLPDTLPMLGVSRKNPETPWRPEALADVLAQSTQPFPRVWVVFTHSPWPLRNQIRQWFEEGYRLKQTQKYSSVDVLLYERVEAAAAP